MIVRHGKAELSAEVVGAGPPALLLHAGVTDSRSWAPLVERLAPSMRTIAYDRRGFGATAWIAEPFSEVDDACAVLDAAGAPTAKLVGGSMGGRVALDLALAHPGRVSSLVLVGSAARGAPAPEDLPGHVQALSDAIDAAEEAGDLAEVNRLEAHLWLDGPAAPEGRVTGPARDLFLAMNGRALAAPSTGPEADLPSAWDRLEKIGVPALVLVGELDVPYQVDRSRALAERIPGARLEVLPGVAHLPQLEADRTFLALVEEFLLGN